MKKFCLLAISLACTLAVASVTTTAQTAAELTNIPSKFTGKDALSSDKLTLKPGTNARDVVSFKLDPKFKKTAN